MGCGGADAYGSLRATRVGGGAIVLGAVYAST